MTRTREQKGWGNRTEYVTHYDTCDGLKVPLCRRAHPGDNATTDIFAVTCKVCRKLAGIDCRICGQELQKDEHEDGKCMACFLTHRRRRYYADDDPADLNPEL